MLEERVLERNDYKLDSILGSTISTDVKRCCLNPKEYLMYVTTLCTLVLSSAASISSRTKKGEGLKL
jgi:hypothetical protein